MYTAAGGEQDQWGTRVTGPAAEEVVGALALPLTIDGQPHQAMGAWIAKRVGAN